MSFQGDFIFKLTGLILVAVLVGLGYLARRTTNSDVLRRGLSVEAQIVAVRQEVGRFRSTYVTYRFTPHTQSQAIEITKKLDGTIDLPVGANIEVKYLPSHPSISLLVPYEKLHSAS